MVEYFALQMQQIQDCQNKVDKAKLERFTQQSELNQKAISKIQVTPAINSSLVSSKPFT